MGNDKKRLLVLSVVRDRLKHIREKEAELKLLLEHYKDYPIVPAENLGKMMVVICPHCGITAYNCDEHLHRCGWCQGWYYYAKVEK